MKSKRVRVLLTVVLCLFVVTCGLGITVYALNGASDGTICDGIYVNSIPLGGMTEEEAEATLNEYVDRLKETTITLSVDGRGEEETTLKVLGFEADSHSFIEEAEAVGKTGNLIRRYKEIKDVGEETLQFAMSFSIKEDAIRSYVESLSERYDIAAVNAELSRADGQFIVTPHVDGRKINVEESIRLIRETVLEQWNLSDPIYLGLAVEDDKPQYTTEDLQKVDTILGSYTTEYPTSQVGRARNVENGARLINGSILYPGDVLSADEKMRPYTIENGYGVGGAYLNGEVIDSVGGGICQVSTTLYNAVLYAELEIVERAAHSMTVNYVPLSRDAAIAGDYKDFKFRNNLDIPIYVEGIAKNGKITFNIYGCETRDMSSHKVDFEYEIVETKKPGKDVVKEDPTKPKSYEEVTQGAFTGYTTHLYKLTYENGALVEKKRINTSYYKSSPRYIIRGTGEEPEEEEPEEADKKEEVSATGKPSGKPSEKPSGKPSEKPEEEPEDTGDESGSEDSHSDIEPTEEMPEEAQEGTETGDGDPDNE